MIIETIGVVLKRSSYQEDRVLLDLFTEHCGKISVLVHRAQKSKYSNQLFHLGHWQLKEGNVFHFSEDYDAVQLSRIEGLNVWSGYYLNELLVRLFPRNQPDIALFTQYWRAIKALEYDDKILQEWMLRSFERSLLEALGQMPDCYADNEGDEFVANLFYHLSVDSGFNKVKPKTQFLPILGQDLLLINRIIENNDHALIDRELLLVYKKMMQFLLQPLLQGKPLQSKLWLQSLLLKQRNKQEKESI